jgi:hypothetical protein
MSKKLCFCCNDTKQGGKMIRPHKRTFSHRRPDKYICRLCFSQFDSKGAWHQKTQWFTIPYKWNQHLYDQYVNFYEGIQRENHIESKVWEKLGYTYDKICVDYDGITSPLGGVSLHAGYWHRFELHDEWKEQYAEFKKREYGQDYYYMKLGFEQGGRDYNFYVWPKSCRPMQDMYYVGEFYTNERYGGPEEGGWWYSYEELTHWTTFPTRKSAEAYVEGRNRYLKHTNPNRFARTMVLPMERPFERPFYE